MKMEQKHEFVDNSTHSLISVNSEVVKVLDVGMFSAQSPPSSIRSHGSNPTTAKKFNIGNRKLPMENVYSNNPSPTLSAVCVCVCQVSVSKDDTSPG